MRVVKYLADLGSRANIESRTNSKWSKNRLNLSFCCGVLTRAKASSTERTPLKSINPWLILGVGVGDRFVSLLGVGDLFRLLGAGDLLKLLVAGALVAGLPVPGV